MNHIGIYIYFILYPFSYERQVELRPGLCVNFMFISYIIPAHSFHFHIPLEEKWKFSSISYCFLKYLLRTPNQSTKFVRSLKRDTNIQTRFRSVLFLAFTQLQGRYQNSKTFRRYVPVMDTLLLLVNAILFYVEREREWTPLPCHPISYAMAFALLDFEAEHVQVKYRIVGFVDDPGWSMEKVDSTLSFSFSFYLL